MHSLGILFLANIAFSKPASQGSTERNASLSVDGDSSATEGTCSLTADEEAPWWMVDLLQDFMVTSIIISHNINSGNNCI